MAPRAAALTPSSKSNVGIAASENEGAATIRTGGAPRSSPSPLRLLGVVGVMAVSTTQLRMVATRSVTVETKGFPSSPFFSLLASEAATAAVARSKS